MHKVVYKQEDGDSQSIVERQTGAASKIMLMLDGCATAESGNVVHTSRHACQSCASISSCLHATFEDPHLHDLSTESKDNV